MRSRRLAIALLLGMLTAGLVATPATYAAAGTTRMVDADGHASAGDCSGHGFARKSIQKAVDDAADNDTILVCPGTYEEQVTALGRNDLTIRSTVPFKATIMAPRSWTRSRRTSWASVSRTATPSRASPWSPVQPRPATRWAPPSLPPRPLASSSGAMVSAPADPRRWATAASSRASRSASDDHPHRRVGDCRREARLEQGGAGRHARWWANPVSRYGRLQLHPRLQGCRHRRHRRRHARAHPPQLGALLAPRLPGGVPDNCGFAIVVPVSAADGAPRAIRERASSPPLGAFPPGATSCASPRIAQGVGASGNINNNRVIGPWQHPVHLATRRRPATPVMLGGIVQFGPQTGPQRTQVARNVVSAALTGITTIVGDDTAIPATTSARPSTATSWRRRSTPHQNQYRLRQPRRLPCRRRLRRQRLRRRRPAQRGQPHKANHASGNLIESCSDDTTGSGSQGAANIRDRQHGRDQLLRTRRYLRRRHSVVSTRPYSAGPGW